MNELVKRKKTRLIKGLLLKCVDGAWKDGDGCVPSTELLVIGLTHGLQCWKDKERPDDFSEEDGPLPDVDELNAQIPQAEWGLGLDNKPRPPWQFNWVAYLFNPETADTYTYLNSTTGARIAVERLETKFEIMRRLRGNNVVPLVKLDSRPMRTAFGPKLRPEFTIIEWRDLGDGGVKPPQLPPPTDKDPIGTAAKPEEKKKMPIAKPVAPITREEELDDEIPF
jgi:hypothetical protein